MLKTSDKEKSVKAVRDEREITEEWKQTTWQKLNVLRASKDVHAGFCKQLWVGQAIFARLIKD